MSQTARAARIRAETDSKVIAELSAGPASAIDIAPCTGFSLRTVQQAIQRLKAEGRIRIASHERTPGGFRPIYGLGNEPDAKEPKPLTRRDINQNYRRKNLALLRAKARVATGFAAFYQQLARTA